jgi:hypothetical protein
MYAIIGGTKPTTQSINPLISSVPRVAQKPCRCNKMTIGSRQAGGWPLWRREGRQHASPVPWYREYAQYPYY